MDTGQRRAADSQALGSSTPQGRTKKNKTNNEYQSCANKRVRRGVWGPILHNKNEEQKRVGPLAPQILHTFIAISRHPDPLQTQLLRNFNIVRFWQCTWGWTTRSRAGGQLGGGAGWHGWAHHGHRCTGRPRVPYSFVFVHSPRQAGKSIKQQKVITIARRLGPERVLGPRLGNRSVKNARGQHPHTFFAPLLCSLGPRTASGYNFCTILIFCVFRTVHGIDNYNARVPYSWGPCLHSCPN